LCDDDEEEDEEEKVEVSSESESSSYEEEVLLFEALPDWAALRAPMAKRRSLEGSWMAKSDRDSPKYDNSLVDLIIGVPTKQNPLPDPLPDPTGPVEAMLTEIHWPLSSRSMDSSKEHLSTNSSCRFFLISLNDILLTVPGLTNANLELNVSPSFSSRAFLRDCSNTT
jgi:hypothetical protein